MSSSSGDLYALVMLWFAVSFAAHCSFEAEAEHVLQGLNRSVDGDALDDGTVSRFIGIERPEAAEQKCVGRRSSLEAVNEEAGLRAALAHVEGGNADEAGGVVRAAVERGGAGRIAWPQAASANLISPALLGR